MASNAEDARTRLNYEPIELILCDVLLPQRTGIELVAGVTSDGFDGAVIMVTGLDDPAYYRSALDLGAYGYLIKPVAKNQLLVSVANALRRLSLEKEVRSYIGHLEKTKAHLEQTVRNLKRANQKIIAQQESLIEKERLKALLEMARTAAHEINQPLMALLVHIELMGMDRDDPDAMDEHIQAIETSGQQVSVVIKKMQDIQHYATIPYHKDENMIDLDQ